MGKMTFLDEVKAPFTNHASKMKRGGNFLIIVIIFSFIMGLLGGVGGLVILSSSTIGAKWRAKLGIKDGVPITLNRTKTTKIVVEENSAIIEAVKKVKPAVVSITGETKQEVGSFGMVIPSSQTAGSGFIITSDGEIVTNKHVVADDNAKYTVYTADGKKHDAKVLARDPYNDFAIVKIDAKSLPVVELGDSDQLEIGQWVIAIGNALGEFDNTVTVGVISAKNRSVSPTDSSTGQQEKLAGLLQTDAPIFSGNSGGPMVNLAGQVVGINTAKGPEQGLGFAIPVNAIKSAISSVQKTGKIIRPMLGVSYMPITADLARSYNLSVNYGVLVFAGQGASAIIPGSPAEKVGLRSGDIITDINSQRIDADHDLRTIIQQYNPGDQVTLKIIRDKKPKTLKVTLAEMK